MDKLIEAIFTSPIANLFLVAGLAFLGIAVVGNISGKIQPGIGGRILSGLIGIVLIAAGFIMYKPQPGTPAPPTPVNIPALIATQEEVAGMPPALVPATPTLTVTIIPPTFTPTPTLMLSGFRIVEVFLRADPFDYVGACPVMITFSGRISVAGGSGTVSYKWIRNDGASAPVEALTFTGPGSKDISATWYLGDSVMNYSGWQAIEIFDPQATTSAHAEFNIQCQ